MPHGPVIVDDADQTPITLLIDLALSVPGGDYGKDGAEVIIDSVTLIAITTTSSPIH